MKTLIVYFSRAGQNWFNGKKQFIKKGNTEVIAEYIQEETSGDMLKLKMEEEYSSDYEKCCNQALKDKNSNARPALKDLPNHIDEYDVIYLGYPIYWSLAPMAVYSFLDHFDCRNKKIYPFATHEGSGYTLSVLDLKKQYPHCQFLDPIQIPGSVTQSYKDKIKEWVSQH